MGILSGYKMVEFAGIGPAPMAAMLLSDMGAAILRIDRIEDPSLGIQTDFKYDLLARGRRSIAIDLKQPKSTEALLKLIHQSNALIEGFRPGVMERLGLGPEVCLERNPRLIYGRMTGWGQDGPLAQSAGHDINYIALTGVLHSIGCLNGPPIIPLNLVGDFGGGGVYLALGIVSGLLGVERTGVGQVIDSAMIDGASSLMTAAFGLYAAGQWTDRRGENILDGGAPYYNVYETLDGKHIAIGSIEPKFYKELLRLLGKDKQDLPGQNNRRSWTVLAEHLRTIFRTKTQDEWCKLLEGTEVCFSPVLSMKEVPNHPHHKKRETFKKVSGIVQPAPTPRFQNTPSRIQRPPAKPGEHTKEALSDWGFSSAELKELQNCGAIKIDS